MLRRRSDRDRERGRQDDPDPVPGDSELDRIEQAGCHLYPGSGRFTSPSTVWVGDRSLRFRKAIVATGSSRTGPIMELLNDCLTNCTDQDTMIVMGSMPRALEISHHMSRICSRVTLLCKRQLISHLQPHHCNDIVSFLHDIGVRVVFVSKFIRVSDSESHPERVQVRALFLDEDGEPRSVQAHYVLDLNDNRSNVSKLDLGQAG